MAKDDDDAFSLNNLSPEERAAIAEDHDDEEAGLDAVIAEGKQALKVVEEDDDEEVVDDQAAAPAAAKVEDIPSAEEFQPIYTAPKVENFNERMTALNAEKTTAFKQMMDGELSAEEYSAIEEKYLTQRDELRAAQDRFVTAEQMKEQTAQQRWQWEVEGFKKSALKADGVDYVKDDKMNNALDRWVKVLANDPDNANQTGEWFLQEAHRHVKQQYNIGKQIETKAPEKSRAPDLSKIPPTLGRLPAADDGDTGKNEYAHMENLTGMAFEKALAKMTPDQQERYLASV